MGSMYRRRRNRNTRSWGCVAGLDCIVGVIRALKIMGFCLSADVRGDATYGSCSAASSPLMSPWSGKLKRGGSERRQTSFDSEVQKIPGRMYGNGSSNIASMFTKQGKKGTNQDAMIVWENFGSRTDTVFCGVFDGHGPNGHLVAKEVRDSLPQKLNSHWEANMGMSNENVREYYVSTTSQNLDENVPVCSNDDSKEDDDSDPEIFTILKESFLKAYKVMDKELRLHPNIDCFCSGTTSVTLVKQGQHLIIGYIGDSRAILGRRDQNDSLIAVQLTVDLKPNLPKEEERIKKCNGRVFAFRDEPDVARVWLPHNDSPGLAMARAFGDFCLKDYGLISVPEVSYRQLTDRDEFIVLATDGVWDVLSNKEVVEIVASSSAHSSAARCIVESAVFAWRCKYPTSKIDDCAVVCLFLNKSSDSCTTSANDISSYTVSSENMDQPEGNTGKNKQQLNGEGDDWSALEGVSRTNTILTLPRFDTSSK